METAQENTPAPHRGDLQMISSELIREELTREYGVIVKGRIDWYIASCGHIVAVVGNKSYHLDMRPTILSL